MYWKVYCGILSPFIPNISNMSQNFQNRFRNGMKGKESIRRKKRIDLKNISRFANINARKVECCGIVGYMGSGNAQSILIQGIEILQNRGYDSCGMSTLDGKGGLFTTKFASSDNGDAIEHIKNISKDVHEHHNIGIAHTRWATHGGKTDLNAHPHQDYKNRISLVHNGTIENYLSLREELVHKGIHFLSETDTEVIANLIGSYLDEGKEFSEAVESALSRLQGTWGIAILHRDYPNVMILARHGSPLLVGVQSDHIYVASETSALANYTNQYVALQDGEIAVLSPEGIKKLITPSRLIELQHEKVEPSPFPYSHWTMKEIFEQPHALARSLNFGGRISPYNNKVKLGGLDVHKNELSNIENLVILGCGTSYHAGIFAQLIMENICGFNTVSAKDASETQLTGYPKYNAGIIAVSQSGETADTVKATMMADKLGIPKISVVNVVGSLLARTTGCGVYLNAGREVAVASTKAFTTQVLVLCLIATWFAQNREINSSLYNCNELLEAIHRVPISIGTTLQVKDQCEQIAKKLIGHKNIFVLGRGLGYPVAMEGALKIKEISYIHAEGYPGGALKHGPFALIDKSEGTPVFLVILSDEYTSLMLNVAQQVKARGAKVICITDNPQICQDVASECIVIPSNGPLTALNAVIPFQLIAYYLAVQQGIDPDKPRGLAKTVTVF